VAKSERACKWAKGSQLLGRAAIWGPVSARPLSHWEPSSPQWRWLMTNDEWGSDFPFPTETVRPDYTATVRTRSISRCFSMELYHCSAGYTTKVDCQIVARIQRDLCYSIRSTGLTFNGLVDYCSSILKVAPTASCSTLSNVSLHIVRINEIWPHRLDYVKLGWINTGYVC